MSVRLLSCETGKLTNSAWSFAQRLANMLNATVYAPDKLLWITDYKGDYGAFDSDGPLDANGSGYPDYTSPGKWNTFNPKKGAPIF